MEEDERRSEEEEQSLLGGGGGWRGGASTEWARLKGSPVTLLLLCLVCTFPHWPNSLPGTPTPTTSILFLTSFCVPVGSQSAMVALGPFRITATVTLVHVPVSFRSHFHPFVQGLRRGQLCLGPSDWHGGLTRMLPNGQAALSKESFRV